MNSYAYGGSNSRSSKHHIWNNSMLLLELFYDVTRNYHIFGVYRKCLAVERNAQIMRNNSYIDGIVIKS